MRINEIATKQVIGVASDDSLRAAGKHLADDEIGALIVFDSTGEAGILSERDLTRAVADGVDLDDTRVEEYMTESPVHLDEKASLDEAIRAMTEFGIRHVAVSRGGAVIGMISARDVLAAVNRMDVPLGL
jgi:signal-transduction protein with cAMP-binding, CBS, and nucleotidyltransferase domain